jgi:hypothetical protein
MYEVWRHDGYSWVSTGITSRWRWLARVRAWEHTKRGWFSYEARPANEAPVSRGL